MKIQINITKEVLRASMYCSTKGSQKECLIGQNCAIGMAIFRLFGQISWVDGDYIQIYRGGLTFNEGGHIINDYQTRIPLPQVAKNFIKMFDSELPEFRPGMAPLSFEIDVPNEVIDMIGIGQVYKVLSESKTLELVKI